MRRLGFVVFIVLALWGSNTAHGAAPLDIPIPSDPTLEDVLATTNGSGEAHGIVPGAAACESAPHRELSFPADDGPHNDTELEYWWWYGHVATADGRRFSYDVTFTSKPWAHYYGLEYNFTDLSNGTYHWGRQPLILGQPQPTDDGFVARAGHASRRRWMVEPIFVSTSMDTRSSCRSRLRKSLPSSCRTPAVRALTVRTATSTRGYGCPPSERCGTEMRAYRSAA